MSEYTELPWRMRKSGISKCGLIYSQDDVLIAKVETHEDADMIVRAVNSHAELLAACKAMADILDSVEVESLRLRGVRPDLRAALAAIRKAEAP
jgi:hypothetical protein